MPEKEKTVTTPVDDEGNLTLVRPGIDRCPFCGWPGIKSLSWYIDKNGHRQKQHGVICENNKCNASIDGTDFEDARRKWNARHK